MTNLVKGEWYLDGDQRRQYVHTLERPLPSGTRHLFQDSRGAVDFYSDNEITYIKPIPRTITVELPKHHGFTWRQSKPCSVSLEFQTQAEAEAAVAALRKAGEQ